MPPAPQAVTPTELTTIKNWILSVRVVGPLPAPAPGSGPTVPEGMTVFSDAVLKPQAMRLLQVNCAGCHQSDALGGISKIMDVDHIVSTGLVVMGDATKGRLIGSIQDGSMPARGSHLTLSTGDRQVLSSWIGSMKLVPINPAAPSLAPLPVLMPSYQSISANILIPKCTSCHGAARADSGIRYDSYAATMRTVSANSAANSKLYTECRNGSMPDRPFVALSAAEISTIQTWINLGAGNN